MVEGFCTECGAEIESFEGLDKCPKCGTRGIPCANKNQAKVDINIHELRILCMWAEGYVQQMKDEFEQARSAKVVRAIASRLLKQLPEGTILLLSDEIEEIRKKGFDVETSFLGI